jgi:hypothetical protein
MWSGKIISGGQTGVDRAALDVALELGIPCGGWCPKGRKAEDGVIPDKYPLQETESGMYTERTGKNLRESDGTLILTEGKLSGGTALTARECVRAKKSQLIVRLDETNVRNLDWTVWQVECWLWDNGIKTLNIAGPRESKCPGIHDRAAKFLREVFA